ncbi:hypothetical protein B0H66DRAFT_550148 [Apodospora peruviana]|uniref:Clr5 domain-containing protein n=1 Tax=Apodospora peruviana TaxID=516989 RepID=A0AAE0MB53_9PEZI|nr:hypothetical protein B0H66DRAFT_550148 [Apodospora peruviana]
MELPALAPRRPNCPVTSNESTPAPPLSHTAQEWTAMYPEIKRLYVHERRRLQYVMRYMEREHGFKATQQMYKKRFAKWGFQKNSKARNTPPQSTTGKRENEAASRDKPNQLGTLVPVPILDHHNYLSIRFLTSVRTWAVSFFESVKSTTNLNTTGIIPPQQQWPPTAQAWWSAKSGETGFTFKLVIDLLNRGHGDLAGRMARKAFLLLEDILSLEGPALAWNLLDIMHNMVMLRQTQLFQMLVAHLVALAESRMLLGGTMHPLIMILRSLGGFITAGRTDDPAMISSLLERAWVLNAEIVFENFDPRLIMVYSRMDWESCSIDPPRALFGTTGKWIAQIRAGHITPLPEVKATKEFPPVSRTNATTMDGKNMLQMLLAPRTDASPPRDYERLRSTSIATLRERSKSLLSNNQTQTFNNDTTALLGMLASLVTDEVLEHAPRNIVSTGVPRIHAGNVACVIRTLLNLGHVEGKEPLKDTIEKTRIIVALREYAQGETDPQVIREMWALRDALVSAGEYEEAEGLEREIKRRVGKYIEEIPRGSAHT